MNSPEQLKTMYIEEKMELLENKVLLLSQEVVKLREAAKVRDVEIYYTTNEAAKLLNKSRSALLDQIRLGKIKAIKTSPDSKFSRYKVSLSEINRLLEKMR